MVAALAAAAAVACTARWWQPGEIAASLRGQQLMVIGLLAVAACGLAPTHRRRVLWALVAIAATMVPAAVVGSTVVAPVVSQKSLQNSPARRPWTLRCTNVLTSNQAHELIADSMAASGADVVATLETGSACHRVVGQRLAASHPHQLFDLNSAQGYGQAIYSRLPLREVHRSPRAVAVQIDSDGTVLIIVHAATPMSPDSWIRRNTLLDELAALINEYRGRDQRVVLAGDLNLTAWSPAYLRLVRRTGMRRVGMPWWPTWYARAKATWPLGLAIDHILVTPNIDAGELTIGEDIGSDHRPVQAVLR